MVARRSYLKTINFAIAGFLAAIATMLIAPHFGSPWIVTFLMSAALIATPVLAFIIASGCVVLARDTRMTRGEQDLFLMLNRDRSEAVLAASMSRVIHSWWRKFFAPQKFIVGEWVEVRSWNEIQLTLDASGALDGMPFMAEMLPYCGKRARILRGVDKVYDYGGTKTLRRLEDCVLLANTRCDGASHGGCQARCSMFWKTDWLKPVSKSDAPEAAISVDANDVSTRAVALNGNSGERFICQYTQIVASSSPMHTWDFRQDLRPLLAGNVSIAAFFVAVMTWLFNGVQGLRGGIPFPYMAKTELRQTPAVDKKLDHGARVSVLSASEISATLDATGRNRGLWFDREMTKHCQQQASVALRVDRIIDDVHGRMVPMKTPCILLDGVVASGEFQRFCAQQEFLFWREIWLDTKTPPSEGRV